VRAARWIESRGHDRSEDRAEMLAHHYHTALELTRAAGGDSAALEEPTRLALREAGSRAYALSSLESAADLYTKALALWPKDELSYPRLLLALGQTLMWMRSEGAAELAEAADLLLASGAVEEAALAEANLANVHWSRGAQRIARSHYDRSIELIAGIPETRTTARIRGDSWRVKLLANEHDASLEEGRHILALAEELGSTEDILTARINLGIGYAVTGDPQAAIRSHELTLEQALQANSHLATRACLNLGSACGTAGDLRRSAELHREGIELARRFGSFQEQWLLAECAVDDYVAGSWDAAIAGATAFLEHGTMARYMEVSARTVLAATSAARGASHEAGEHAQILLTRGREVADPQAFWGALGECARLAVEAGRKGEAEALVGELAAAFSAARSFDVEVTEIGGFLAAAALGLGPELGRHLGKAGFTSPWVEAALQITEGRLDEAGETLHVHEAHVYAAMVRLFEAELAGRETPGLRAAVSFYENVGATAYLARGEALLRDAG